MLLNEVSIISADLLKEEQISYLVDINKENNQPNRQANENNYKNNIYNNNGISIEVKQKNKIDEIGGEKEEKINDNNLIDNKNNESKDESFELEENKENERMFQNFISCPKSKFVIYFSIIGYFSFNFIDVILIAFGVFKDKYGEDLYLGS